MHNFDLHYMFVMLFADKPKANEVNPEACRHLSCCFACYWDFCGVWAQKEWYDEQATASPLELSRRPAYFLEHTVCNQLGSFTRDTVNLLIALIHLIHSFIRGNGQLDGDTVSQVLLWHLGRE